MADDPDQANNFDYTVPSQTGPSDIRCPFVAHTRKTAPRNLDPYVDKKFLESALVVRGGMPYGKEVRTALRYVPLSIVLAFNRIVVQRCPRR